MSVPRWQLRYAIACLSITGWSIAYALAAWGQWPRLVYDPMRRDLTIARTTGPLPIDYWGLVAWGAAGALCAGGLAWIAARVWRRPLPRVALGLLGLWALTAFVYAGGYFFWTLQPFGDFG